MSYARFNIALKRIREVVEQSAGTLRPVPAGRFGGELPEGLNDESAMAKAASVPRVESSITSIEPSSSSPPVLGDLRIYEVQVTVKVVRVLSALEQVSDADRDELHALAAQDADVLSQALGFPGNLSRTAGGLETEIVSGLLVYRSSSVLVKKPTDDGAQPVITSHVFRGHMISRPSQERDFIILIQTNATASGLTPATSTNQFRFYGVGNYDIEWGDGTTSFGVSGTQTKTYDAPGVYKIRVKNWGGATRQYLPVNSFTTDAIKIMELRQWGSVQWTSCAGMFRNCDNMIGVYSDSPNLTSTAISCASMFRLCRKFNGSPFNDMGSWGMKNVVNLNGMFASDTVANTGLANIQNWDVSNVTDPGFMFQNCAAFNQPLNNWKLSSATTIAAMFDGCSAFNQPLNSWAFGNITDMSFAFQRCAAFNQPLPWNTGTVTNMANMFASAVSFNQPSVASWAVNSVTNMNDMFSGANSFNQDLGAWILNDAVTMTNMLNTTSTTTGMSAENYSRTLIGWSNERKTSGTPINRSLGANNRRYNATVYGGAPFDNAVSARADLVLATGSGGGGWTITGDAQI